MATDRAVETACTAVVRVLQDALDPATLASDTASVAEPPRVRLVGQEDLAGRSRPGVDVLAYAVQVDPAVRSAGPPLDRGGARTPSSLPVEVHLLVLVSGGPATRLALSGRVLRALADTPVLTADQLNTPGEDQVFGAEDSVRVVPETLDAGELLRRTGALGLAGLDVLALPYAVTGIDISSDGSG